MPGSAAIESRIRSPQVLSARSEALAETAMRRAVRRISTWLTIGFSVSTGKVVIESTAFLISESARSTG